MGAFNSQDLLPNMEVKLAHEFGAGVGKASRVKRVIVKSGLNFCRYIDKVFSLL